MNRRSDVAAVLCIAGPTLRRSFELPVKRTRSFDRRSNVPGLMIGTDDHTYVFVNKVVYKFHRDKECWKHPQICNGNDGDRNFSHVTAFFSCGCQIFQQLFVTLPGFIQILFP